jgi:hypothetical protein
MTAARSLARSLAIGRVVFGVGALVAPRVIGRAWVGPHADNPGPAVLARGLGIRDIVLGMIALHTVDHPEVGPRWQRTLAVCDLVDLGSTLAARDAVPPASLAVTVLSAGGAAAGELWAAQALRR